MSNNAENAALRNQIARLEFQLRENRRQMRAMQAEQAVFRSVLAFNSGRSPNYVRVPTQVVYEFLTNQIYQDGLTQWIGLLRLARDAIRSHDAELSEQALASINKELFAYENMVL
jgi:hypothetical protein